MSLLPKATASNKQISTGNVFAKCYKNCVKIPDFVPKNLIQGGSLRLGRHRAHDSPPQKFPSDFPGSSLTVGSLTVELKNNPEVPRKLPRLPGSSPDFPASSPDFPGG